MNSKSPLLLNLRKPSPYKSALAERMARLRAQAAAAEARQDSTRKVTIPDSAREVRHGLRFGQPEESGRTRRFIKEVPSSVSS